MPLADLDGIDIDPALEPALPFVDSHVVPAHLPLAHQAILGKRPVLQPVGAPPLACLILPFVPKLDSDLRSCQHPRLLPCRTSPKKDTDLVVRKRKQLLPQPVLPFLGPLLAQELDDLVPPLEEGVAVAPDRVRRVGELDELWVSWPVLARH